MRVNRERHLALYGNVGMIRAMCPTCNEMALVAKHRFLCCSTLYGEDPVDSVVRVSSPAGARHGPSKEARVEILDRQGHRCAWCERAFESTVHMRGRARKLIVHWDHVLPHAFSQDNHDSNFVAACQFCNLWKSSMVFTTEDEVKLYVAKKWAREEAREMSRMRGGLRDFENQPPLLLGCVPESRLAQVPPAE